jgi:three-Cys-motif partner protein
VAVSLPLEGARLSDDSKTIWEIEPHTEAKHEILRRYLEAWLPILSKYSPRIIYLDGFAGPGVYSGGEDGSPVIALETAVKHVLQAHFKEIVFFFIEKDQRRAKMLEKVLAERFPRLPNNMKYQVIGAAFAPTFELVLDRLDKGGAMLAPTFAFLDPFGFSGLPMKLIGRMMKCDKCEVLVTFMVGFIKRFLIEDREAALNELFATDEWKKANELEKPDDRLKFLVNLYEKQLKCVGDAQHVRSFAMTNKQNQIIYYLVFGTKHPKGLEVMKEAMWKTDRTGSYGFSDLSDPNQITFMDIGDKPYWVPKAAEMVYKKFRGQTVSVEKIHEFIVTGTAFLYRTPILQYLEKSSPLKIVRVDVPKPAKRRAFTYPEHCSVTFCS